MGPLKGYRIVEIAGIGPGPFACMMLADMGADVLRLERPTGPRGVDAVPGNVANRSRRSVGLDLKNPDAVELVLRLVEGADALIEGFRPGVAERLGIGPDACLARNPRLVYGRMTGWGQDRPYATMAGNVIDGGAHFYDAYETADGKYISIGSIEPQFYAELLRLTGLDGEDLPHQMDRAQWPALKERVAGIFKQKTRAEWCELMEGTDVCFAPVLTMDEAPAPPHNQARGTFVDA